MPASRRKAPARPRRRRRKDARPSEIIEAGIAEFAQHGFAGARLEDVARRAGIAKSTIYLYFADKQSLFVAAMRSSVMPVLVEIDQFVDAFPGTSTDLLRLLLTTVHRRIVHSDARILMRIIISEGNKFPELTELYYRETTSKGLDLIRRIVARGVERGEFRRGPASEMPEVIIGPAVMAAVWQTTFQQYAPLDAERFAAAHIDLVLNGLCARLA